MNHQPIETRYAGCHFRSRLEARWAVFFDSLKIRWEYEPQGFELPWRLCGDWVGGDPPIRYLPDFWLPTFNQWVEVKGAWTQPECEQFLNAAAALSAPGSGCGEGPSTLILGPTPRPHQGWSPWCLHMHKGDLEATRWTDGQHHQDHITVARDNDWIHPHATSILLDGATRQPPRTLGDKWRDEALVAARSARFEHGQSGAT